MLCGPVADPLAVPAGTTSSCIARHQLARAWTLFGAPSSRGAVPYVGSGAVERFFICMYASE